jgi:heptosyltransferase-3
VQILILHPGALGDIILSLPAITLLRSRFPSARLTIAGNIDHITPIISGYAERIVSLSTLPLHRLYAPGLLSPEEAHFWQSFDRIVSWTGSGDAEFARKLKQIHPDVDIASWKPQPGEHRHVSQLFAQSLGFEVSNKETLPPALVHIDSAARDEGLRWLAERGWSERDFLSALHAGAGSKEKRWHISRFVGLARHLALQEKGKLLIIEGPAESGLAKQIVQTLPQDKTIPAESLPLNVLAAVMERCRDFVGSDSGIAHLAAAAKVPSVVLFGPTLPQHWAPLGSHVVVLRDACGCEGCNGRMRHHTCLENITIEEVIRNLEIERPDAAI